MKTKVNTKRNILFISPEKKAQVLTFLIAPDGLSQ